MEVRTTASDNKIWHHSWVMVCDQNTWRFKPLGLVNQLVATIIVYIICDYKTSCKEDHKHQRKRLHYVYLKNNSLFP